MELAQERRIVTEIPGPKSRELFERRKNAVPKADFELDPGPYMLALQAIEIGIQCASKIAVVKGFITEDGISHSVDNPATLEFKVVCGFPVFK